MTIKLIYLIPGFALLGIFLGGLIGWVIYRRMLRKPLMPTDDGALLIGPRYIGIQEPERHHNQGQDNERRGQLTQMKNHLPGTIHSSTHFRWPSFNEKPVFHPERGFHVPDEYLHDDDPLLALPLTTRPSANVNTRTKSTRTTHTSKSARTFKKSKRPTLVGHSLNDFSSPNSDTTSLALLELYESDEEEEARRKACEVPWESLRHKSIKRGILEQVKQEGKWLDSIRGLAGSHPKTIKEECNVLLNTSPVKRASNNGVDESQVPQRDILPRSPAQLMSPPLQSQICFTPIPVSSARVESQNYSKSRILSPTKPLVVKSASKSRKVRSPQNFHRLPKPPLSVNKDTQHESPQGRLVQKSPGTNYAVRHSKESADESQGDGMLEDPMEKVERIMASSWSARDLGQGGMRNLSPTGFGRRL